MHGDDQERTDEERLPRQWTVRWSRLIALVCALLLGLLPLTDFLERWELRTHDLRFRLRGSRPTSAHIVLAAIGDDTLDAWPEPDVFWGARYAAVIRQARIQGAEWIGLDVVLTVDVDEYNPQQRPTYQMQRALQWAKGRVVLASVYAGGGKLVKPTERLASLVQTAENLGFINLPSETDETVRVGALYVQDREGYIPSFTALLAARIRGQPPDDTTALRSLGGTWERDPQAPTFRINYTGRTFPTVPAQRLASGPLNDSERQSLRGAVVLIGATYRISGDKHRIPGGGFVSGIEVQAQALATLLDGAALCRGTRTHETLLAVVLAFLLAVLMMRLSFFSGFLLVVGAGFLWFGAAWIAFSRFHALLPLVGPWLGLSLPYLVFHSVRSLEEGVRRRQVEAVFGCYVSAEIRDWLLGDASHRAMGGREGEASVLFVDLRKFTSIAEDQAPSVMMRELNTFFGEIVPAIDRHHGLVFQYTGDGLLAVFGVPYPQEQHAQAALEAAIEIVQAVREGNAGRMRRGLGEWQVGCGLHTGLVASGSLGVASRSEFAAIGDTTNLASRLEVLNREWDSEIVFSEATFARLSKVPAVCGPEEVAIRNRRDRVRVYRMVVAGR